MARNRNHRVDEAENGRDAVDMVRRAMMADAPYQSILMDYEMPILRGPEAVAEIRQLDSNTVIIGVTGNVLQEDVDHFLSKGANRVLGKPVKFAKVLEIWMENGLID